MREKRGEKGLVTVAFIAEGPRTNTRSCDKNHMYIRLESPAEVFVKHFIPKTRGFEDDKCVPKESVIGSGIKGLLCL